jgi:hypothetical protein
VPDFVAWRRGASTRDASLVELQLVRLWQSFFSTNFSVSSIRPNVSDVGHRKSLEIQPPESLHGVTSAVS